MVTVINSWKLDTCSCVLHYYWDNAVPQDQIVTTFFAAENVCPDHQVLIGLDKGEPDWEQPDHTVESENAARFAILGDAIDGNETRNLDSVKNADPEDQDIIRNTLSKHNQRVLNRYGKIFEITNTKAISKGIWNAAKEENDRKNIALDLALTNGPSTLYDVVPGGTARVLKQSVRFTFTWSGTPPNRVLTITFSVALTTNQRNIIQNALNTRFGVGRVILG